VLPFDLVFEYGNLGRIAKFSRIGKIYKLIRITKMARIVHTIRLNNQFSIFIYKILKLGAGFERILYLIITYFILQHVTACIWIFIGRYNDYCSDNWISEKGYTDYSNFDLYLTGLYFTVTTIVTVGYGDITAYTNTERIFCIFLMIIGVFAFSFATGTLASIIAQYDSKQGKLQEKMNILNDIQEEYQISIDFYNELSKNIQYNHRKKSKDLLNFMEELPHRLRLELAMVIHDKLYNKVKFFEKKDKSFIAWISNILRPIVFDEGRYIY
jgi:Ion transport protein